MSTSSRPRLSRGRLGLGLACLLLQAPGLVLGEVPTERNPAATGLMLFAGSAQGLWRSRDWGVSWDRVQGAMSGKSVLEIGPVAAVLPVGPRVLVGGEGGAYFSEDWGDSWKRLEAAGQGTILSLLISRYWQADPTIFVGRSDGLFKSENGIDFEPTGLVGTPVWRVEWPGPALVAATGKGVLVSQDSGKTFSSGTGLPEGDVRALVLSSFFQVDPVLYAGVGREGLYRSKDGGKTWARVGFAGQEVRDLAWWGPILYVVSDAGVFRSSDFGVVWEPLQDGLGNAVPQRILFPQAPDSLSEAFLATDKGLFHTPDGGLHWQRATRSEEAFVAIATFPLQSGPAMPKSKKR